MSFNAKDMTQGGQIASMRIRMFSQIANIMLYCLFIFFWILVGLVLWVKISWQTFVNGCIYWWCTTLEGMRDLIKSQPVYEIQYYGKTFRMNAAQVLHDKYMIWCGEQLWSAFVLATVVALVICLITFFVVSWILGRQGKQQSENEVTGGRQLTDNPKDVARMLKKDGKDSDIRIGDLPIIRDSEIQNFCLHGTVGAGKSEVIRRLANYARQRGDMVVIYDRSQAIRSELKTQGVLGHPEVTMTALSPVWLDSRSRYLRDMYRPGMVMEQWNPETRSHDRYVIDRVAGLVMTVLTVGLVSCAGKSLPRFWPGDFFPVFYACHLAVLGVLAL
ncbi:TPA: type IV secretion system DNA-binding domain-containing protein [Escherichia coli]|nr:type IV secretion system DNA-binding domain-containing protein [Escherichia coli]